MAFAIFNKHKNLTFVSANDEEIDAVYGARAAIEAGHSGYKVSISEADFDSLRLYKKVVSSFDGTSIVLADFDLSWPNETSVKGLIESKKNRLELRKNSFSSAFQTRADAMLSVYDNIDTASLSYPLNTSIETYLDNQGTTVLSDLQF